MTDFYIILGVDRSADQEKIKSAYRRSAKRYHPDTSFCRESTGKFNQITEAYKTLCDAEKRRHYDEKLRREELPSRRGPVEDLIPRGARADRYRGRPFEPFPEDPIADVRPGAYHTYRHARPRQDVYGELVLSPRQAREGGLIPVVLPLQRPCPACAVSDFRDRLMCPHCLGTGRIRSELKFSLSIPPHTVHGTSVTLSLGDIGLRSVDLHVEVRISPSGF
jgi:molecular chaperone DnaJ